jgi:hypothetical protein
MAAPTYGSGFMAIAPPVTSTPVNAAEALPLQDPVFVTAWNATKYLIPSEWEGNRALILAMATLASRYKSGTGVFTPTLTSTTPASVVHGTSVSPLTCTGANIDAGGVIVFNGVDQPTTHIGTTSATCPIAPSQIPIAGNYPVQIRNADGSLSAVVNLVVS